MTTLADLTPEQQNNCVGMWVEDELGNLRILTAITTRINAQMARTFSPTLGRMTNYTPTNLLTPTNLITPRHDIPRAWTPQGAPTPGEWETAKTKIIPNENARYDPETNTITGDGIADTKHEPKSAHDIRRFITEWEPAWPKI